MRLRRKSQMRAGASSLPGIRLSASFKTLLSADDHRWRLDRLLLSDRRWQAGRKVQAAYIRHMIQLLSEAERAKAEARLSVYLRSSSAEKLMDKLPADGKADWGIAYRLVRDAGPLSVNPLKEQRFMAGWISMSYLKDLKTALGHFKAMRDVADGPLSRSKGTIGWAARSKRLDAPKRRARPMSMRRANAIPSPSMGFSPNRSSPPETR